MTLLEVLHLSKHFQRDGHTVRAVDGISFAVEAGSAFALIGESGSGKTTTAYCLARLMEPTAGSIRFDGQNWLSLRGRALRERRHRLQLVFQDPYTSLNPVMTIGETVEEPLRLRG
ncbi:MAG: ATP-binding cassette domain-containing protein, partial [Acidobacteriota bacterium]